MKAVLGVGELTDCDFRWVGDFNQVIKDGEPFKLHGVEAADEEKEKPEGEDRFSGMQGRTAKWVFVCCP